MLCLTVAFGDVECGKPDRLPGLKGLRKDSGLLERPTGPEVPAAVIRLHELLRFSVRSLSRAAGRMVCHPCSDGIEQRSSVGPDDQPIYRSPTRWPKHHTTHLRCICESG
jgi:hypothetical protein